MYPVHPLLKALPPLPPEAEAALGRSLLRNGLLEPIDLHEGVVIDGALRQKLCRDLSVTPRYREVSPRNVAEYIAAKNLHRRHLTASQRAALAALFVREADSERRGLIMRAREIFGVGRQYVYRAGQVLQRDPAAFPALLDGSRPVYRAYDDLCRKPPAAKAPGAPRLVHAVSLLRELPATPAADLVVFPCPPPPAAYALTPLTPSGVAFAFCTPADLPSHLPAFSEAFCLQNVLAWEHRVAASYSAPSFGRNVTYILYGARAQKPPVPGGPSACLRHAGDPYSPPEAVLRVLLDASLPGGSVLEIGHSAGDRLCRLSLAAGRTYRGVYQCDNSLRKRRGRECRSPRYLRSSAKAPPPTA